MQTLIQLEPMEPTKSIKESLRYYQQEALTEVIELWQYHKRVLVQSPTGSGKSLILCYPIKEFLRMGRPVLAIAHKIELISQLRDHIRRWCEVEPGIIADRTQFKRDPSALVQIASIQALSYLKPEQLPPASLVAIDEAHHSHARSYAKIFGHYQNSFFLGATATPLRIDGRGLRYLYDGVPGFEAMVTGVPVRQLIEEGYLANFKIFTGETVLSPEAAGISTRGGDYAQNELEDYAESVLLKGEIVDTWLQHAAGKRTVLYPVSVELSKEYCQEFINRHISAAHIDADTPAKERADILDRFREGKILVLCQHSIVVEGVDVPLIECVQFARPTKSLTVWFQAIGRALRPAEGKPHAIVIDHTDTHQKLPWIDEPIEWSLDPISLKLGTKHALTCPQCHHVYMPGGEDITRLWSTCPHCQTKFKFEVGTGGNGGAIRAIEILPADFQEVERQLNRQVLEAIDALFDRAQKNNYKPAWVAYECLEIPNIGYFELLELAKRLGYKPGWAHYKWREIVGSKNT